MKKRELDLEKQNNENQFEYAKRALEVQAQDLELQRAHEVSVSTTRYVFAGALVVAVLSFLAFTVYTGKERFAEDLIKIMAGALAGGAGGYSYGRRDRSEDSHGQKED